MVPAYIDGLHSSDSSRRLHRLSHVSHRMAPKISEVLIDKREVVQKNDCSHIVNLTAP